MFEVDPTTVKVDFYERLLFHHLLSTRNPFKRTMVRDAPIDVSTCAPTFGETPCGFLPIHRMKMRTYGLVFETMVMQDLRVYADALNGSVSHYLDRNGLECDAVVHLRNGTSGLVEVKLGVESLIDEGAKTLNELSGIIDTSRQSEVAFKMMVTAGGDFAYQRKDGIIVCPLSALKE